MQYNFQIEHSWGYWKFSYLNHYVKIANMLCQEIVMARHKKCNDNQPRLMFENFQILMCSKLKVMQERCS